MKEGPPARFEISLCRNDKAVLPDDADHLYLVLDSITGARAWLSEQEVEARFLPEPATWDDSGAYVFDAEDICPRCPQPIGIPVRRVRRKADEVLF